MPTQDMNPEEIKYRVRLAGTTLAELGRSVGVSRQLMSLSLEGRVSAKAELAIAKCIGVNPHTIWPTRYNLRGERLSALSARAAKQKAAA